MATDQDIKINTLENNYKTMFDQNTKEHSAINDALEKMTEKLDTLIDKMDGRYAKAWTERAWIWLISTCGVVVIGLLVRWLVSIEF